MSDVKNKPGKKIPDSVTKGLVGFFKKDPKIKLIFIAAAIGLILILLSDCSFPTAKKTETPAAPDLVSYVETLEMRLKTILEEMDGVGDVSVFITLGSGSKTVYERDKKLKTQTENGEQTKNTWDEESKVILFGSDNDPLISTIQEPEIKGVVVVCDGGDNIKVVEKVIGAVKTALGVPSSRVAVNRRKSLN